MVSINQQTYFNFVKNILILKLRHKNTIRAITKVQVEKWAKEGAEGGKCIRTLIITRNMNNLKERTSI